MLDPRLFFKMDKNNIEKYILNTLSSVKWQKISIRRRSGILAPLFSVYSKNSQGIGDLKDLELLVDFCKNSSNTILQLLPMNEVGDNLCPYDAISSFAIEPMFISLLEIENSKKIISKDKINELRKKFPNNGEYVNYKIKEEKLKILQDVYLKLDAPLKKKEIITFVEENKYWIKDFALFKVLKKYNNSKAWYEWPDEFKDRDRVALKKFSEQKQGEIDFEIWLQYIIHRQFKQTKQYANSRGIFLKGDLPVLVSRDSADVWCNREFFKLEFAAGAPPDMYCARGQRWGMPTYNWENIAKDKYNYLKEKLKFAQEFYDILRVDHVVGLFRIWSINYDEPQENQGLKGFFDPEDENTWENHGKNILSAIVNNTSMLICAEDLGVIPKACPKKPFKP